MYHEGLLAKMASGCQAFEVLHDHDQSITEHGCAWHLFDDERLLGRHPQVIAPLLCLNSALGSKAGGVRGSKVNP